jgi:hypothetical protein
VKQRLTALDARRVAGIVSTPLFGSLGVLLVCIVLT